MSIVENVDLLTNDASGRRAFGNFQSFSPEVRIQVILPLQFRSLSSASIATVRYMLWFKDKIAWKRPVFGLHVAISSPSLTTKARLISHSNFIQQNLTQELAFSTRPIQYWFLLPLPSPVASSPGSCLSSFEYRTPRRNSNASFPTLYATLAEEHHRPKFPCHRLTTMHKPSDIASADDVIVGGGIAGCTLAARLQKRLPSTSILLIEVGSDPFGDSQTQSATAAP